MTRIACIGDTHFQYGHWRNKDRLAAMEQVVSEGLEVPGLGAWIHLGDIWHAAASDDDLLATATFLQRMAAVAPVLAVLGNHGRDGHSRLMGRLGARWPVIVVDNPQVVTLALPNGACARIAVLPYPHKTMLVSAGVPAGEIRASAEQALDTICMSLASESPHMVVGHLTIAGALSSVGQPMGLENDISISGAALSRFGNVPKVFGHIHKPQEIFGAVYAGSIAASDWGETEAKRWLLVDLEDCSITSRPINTPSMYHVEGTLTRDGFDWRVTKGPDGADDVAPLAPCRACDGGGDGVKDLLEGTLPCAACGGSGSAVDWTSHDVRVRARYAQQERDVLAGARARVMAMFPGCRTLEFEPVAVSNRELRAPEVVQAQTLDEKLQAWARLSGVAWVDRLAQAATRLLATEDGDAVVADVERDLAALAAETEMVEA